MNDIYYNSLAEDFHQKRKKPWTSLENFLKLVNDKKFQFMGYNIDLGCANGRNFKLLHSNNTKLIGVDNSIQFLKIAHQKLKNSNEFSKYEKNSIQLLLSDILFLPIRPKTINNVFSIATVHHIKSKEKRENLLNQISKILKFDGYILISVWRKYQKNYKVYFIVDWIKRIINSTYRKKQIELGLNEFGDKYVPWKISKDQETYLRFYHFFSKKEVKKLFKDYRVEEIKKLGGPNKKDNYFIIAKKE
ncbi:MAG: class I SAM-dependent methyltransferase [Promethearchaeota archaeon]